MSSDVSEMNKPEAERCIEIALAAQSAGDFAKAERFLSKSIAMFPTPRARTLLVQIQSQQTTTSSTTSSSPTSSSYTFQQTTTSSTTTFTTPTPPKPTYTPEQREAARAVIRQTNYYSILNLPLPSSSTPPTDSDIKAAYRKMALKFHPDKNHAPEAEEAFKKVSTAFQCLSDERKKAQYDASGYDDGVGRGLGQQRGGGGGAGHQYYGREEDISPEDIFNMFFGGMQGGGGIYTMNGRRVFTRRPPQRPAGAAQQGQAGPSLMQFIHFLPLLLLFVFSFLSSPSSDESLPFSLSSSSTFSHPRRTTSNLPYFVSPSFTYRYARDRRALSQVEGLVEQEWIKRWRVECEKEKKELKGLEQQMRQKKGKELNDWMEKVEEFKEKKMGNCERSAQGIK